MKFGLQHIEGCKLSLISNTDPFGNYVQDDY